MVQSWKEPRLHASKDKSAEQERNIWSIPHRFSETFRSQVNELLLRLYFHMGMTAKETKFTVLWAGIQLGVVQTVTSRNRTLRVSIQVPSMKEDLPVY